jgi:hypothetical protein
MRFREFASMVLGEAESCGVGFVVAGGVARGAYGVPRAEREVVLLAGVGAERLTAWLARLVVWNPQVELDPVTWSAVRRGRRRGVPAYAVEVRECGGDAHSARQLEGRVRVMVPWLGRAVWLPPPEDVVVDALRRGVGGGVLRDLVEARWREGLEARHVAEWCGRLGVEVPRWMCQAAG